MPYPLPVSQEVKVSRTRGQTRIGSKHQVTLPVDALARAGLRAGDVLVVTGAVPGEIVLRLAEDPIDRHAGALTGVWTPGFLDELREEWH